MEAYSCVQKHLPVDVLRLSNDGAACEAYSTAAHVDEGKAQCAKCKMCVVALRPKASSSACSSFVFRCCTTIKYLEYNFEKTLGK